jgi:hypothetical protein
MLVSLWKLLYSSPTNIVKPVATTFKPTIPMGVGIKQDGTNFGKNDAQINTALFLSILSLSIN